MPLIKVLEFCSRSFILTLLFVKFAFDEREREEMRKRKGRKEGREEEREER
jgi:hypothetical protein